jgi:hypothetical protein
VREYPSKAGTWQLPTPVPHGRKARSEVSSGSPTHQSRWLIKPRSLVSCSFTNGHASARCWQGPSGADLQTCAGYRRRPARRVGRPAGPESLRPRLGTVAANVDVPRNGVTRNLPRSYCGARIVSPETVSSRAMKWLPRRAHNPRTRHVLNHSRLASKVPPWTHLFFPCKFVTIRCDGS